MKKYDSLKSRLDKIDDETLKQLIVTTATAAGMSAGRLASVVKDIPRLRRLLAEADDEQVNSLVSSLGTNDATEVIRRINKEK